MPHELLRLSDDISTRCPVFLYVARPAAGVIANPEIP